MLILLPPSEGKSSPSAEARFNLGSLAFAEQLGAKRSELIAALERLGKSPEKKAVEALGISPGQAGEIARNAEQAVGAVSADVTGLDVTLEPADRGRRRVSVHNPSDAVLHVREIRVGP